MTPDELDTAVREELRAQARLAPASAPVKAHVLQAARALTMEDKHVGGLRAWLVPMLAAAAVLLVTLGVTAGPKLLRSDGPDRTPPAVSSTSDSPTPSASATSPSPSSTAKPPPASTGAASADAAPNPAPSSTAPQDWYRNLDVNALPHTPGLCPEVLTIGTTDRLTARAVSVPGEPAPLWLLPVTCNGMTNASHPLPIEVFRYSPDGPRLVQTLAYEPGDRRSIMVTAINGEGQNLVLAEKGYSPNDALCCRSLRFSQDYTWSTARSRFVAGPQVDTLLQCTGDQLTVTSTPLTSQSGDARGMLLTYVNDGKEPCTLTGYPGAAIVDAAGQPLADAARTPAGALGGYTSEGSAPRVVLYNRPGSAVIEWVAAQHGGSRCHSEATLLSTPPGTTATRSYGAQPLVCDLQVHPVVFDGDGKG
ncbi:MAG TPA: DUF4232 domain-containing protein [Jatrophihabitans sp.]|jgi:hypothetical protein|uniref:DUF4232 domain-containing protein n=1 Tax=Jatrophihabitans sp. TaxID=1932789 RepID=UPI002EFE22AF